MRALLLIAFICVVFAVFSHVNQKNFEKGQCIYDNWFNKTKLIIDVGTFNYKYCIFYENKCGKTLTVRKKALNVSHNVVKCPERE